MSFLKKIWQVAWVDGLGMALAYLLIAPIKVYQFTLSPMLGDVCRYHPTCSRYAVGVLKVHGPFKGLALTAYRLLRCNPFTRGGVDPVPARGAWLPEIYPDGSPR